ncbi:MAG: hypothetical protein V4505_25580 [Pseudomonadota bacterium]
MAFDWANPTDINAAYQQFGNRAGDQAGIDYWTGQKAAGASDEALQDSFLKSIAGEAQPQAATAPAAAAPQGYQPNPYLDKIASSLTAQSNQNLNQIVLPGIDRQQQAAGGYGDTRQGIAQGIAIGNAQTGLNSSIANLYGTSFENQQNRDLSKYGIDSGAYTANRQLDQSGAALGASLFGQGQTGLLSQGQGLYGLGQTQTTASEQPYNWFSSMVSPYSGLGGSTSSTGSVSGSTLGNAAGGALVGSQLAKLYGGGSGYSGSFVPDTSGSDALKQWDI